MSTINQFILKTSSASILLELPSRLIRSLIFAAVELHRMVFLSVQPVFRRFHKLHKDNESGSSGNSSSSPLIWSYIIEPAAKKQKIQTKPNQKN